MKNMENKKKGWLISLLVLLVLFNNISIVNALENDYLEETNLTEIEEEIIEEGVLEDNQEEIIEEELTKEEIFTMYSKNLEFRNNEVIVKGNINELITVSELLDNINIDELINNYSIEKITVTNEEDVLLESIDYVTNKCHLIIISNEYIANYKISFLGDLNHDNLVNDKDIEIGIEDFFEEDINEEENNEVEDTIVEEILQKEKDDEVLSKEDLKDDIYKEIIVDEDIIIEEESITEKVSYVDAVIKNNSYEVDIPNLEEKVSVNLETTNKAEFYVDSNIIVELSLEGFINNYINTISGNIEYNTEILKLENIYLTIDNKVIGKYMNNRFIYVLDNYQDNKSLLLMIFKSIKEGNSSVSINDLKLSMNGTLLNINNDTNLNITILKPGKGGDVEIEIPPIISAPNQNSTKPQTTPNLTLTNKIPSTINNESYQQLSDDNYIKNIEIIGHEINFNKDINNYSINVDNNTNNLNFNIILNNEFATYEIIGNNNFVNGKNEIIIRVTSQMGTTRDYVINVNRDDKKDIIDKKDFNSKEKEDVKISHIIILVFLIITIIILIYKLLIKED